MFDKQILAALRAAAVKFGIPKTDVIPSLLFIYSKLSNSQNTINFVIDDKKSVLANVEQTLDRNNVHFSTHLGLGIHQVVGGKPANSTLDFYPDKNKYAGATGQEAKDLEQVYNAKMELKTDSSVRLEKFKTNVFRSVPFTQNGTSAHPSLGEIALIDIGTVFPIVGGQNNAAKIDIDANSAYAGIAGVNGTSENYAVLIFGGFEVRNGSQNPDFVAYLQQLSRGEISY